MSDEEKLAVAEAYRDATAANDAAALRAIHEPDALTWHNLDGLGVSVDDSARSLAWLHRTVPDLRLDDVRITPTSDGFVVRWTMAGTAPGGTLRLAVVRGGRAVTRRQGGAGQRVPRLRAARRAPLTWARSRRVQPIDVVPTGTGPSCGASTTIP